MEKKTIDIIEDLCGTIKLESTDDGKTEYVIEFPPIPASTYGYRPSLKIDQSEKRYFEQVLWEICDHVDSIQDSASDISFLLFYVFQYHHNLMFFFDLVNRGVPFKKAFDIIHSLFNLVFMADGETACGKVLNYMLSIFGKLTSDVSTVLLSMPQEIQGILWQEKYTQPKVDEEQF